MKMNRMMGLFAATFLITPAFADTMPNPGACKADIQKLCAGIQPGQGRIAACMKQHEADLSDACKQNIAAEKANLKAKMQEFEAACKGDGQKFCADVKPGQGRIIACLQQHQSNLSGGCQTELSNLKNRGMGHPPTNGSSDADTTATPENN